MTTMGLRLRESPVKAEDSNGLEAKKLPVKADDSNGLETKEIVRQGQ
jgi:hypothetical protein